MRKWLTVILLSVLLVQAQAQSEADKTAVNLAVDAFLKSWAQHNFTDMSRYATDDISFINPPGRLTKSRDSVQNRLHQAHQAMLKQTPQTEVSRHTRFITNDVALVTLYTIMGTYYPPDGVDRGNNRVESERQVRTMVVVRRNGQWLLTAVHGTRMDAGIPVSQ